MKPWKESLVQQLVAACEACKIVSLKETALASGIRHIPAQDARDIMAAVLKRVSGFRLAQIMATPNDSFAQSACLVEADVTFDEFEEEM